MNLSQTQNGTTAPHPSPAKKARRFSGKQDRLFATSASSAPGSMNDAAMIRSVLTDAMKTCGLSRVQIADEMSRLIGGTVTERQLNNFSADSREEYRFPAELDRAFCAATGNDQLLTCRAQLAGLHVVDDAGWELLELGREYLRQKRAAAAMADYERRLQGVEIG